MKAIVPILFLGMCLFGSVETSFASDIPIKNSASVGPKHALVTLIMFVDYQCPYTKVSIKTLMDVQKKHAKELRIVIKHFPLSGNKQASDASAALLAAGEQGKYWEMHHLIMENNHTFAGKTPEEMASTTRLFAKKLGLHLKRFDRDYASKTLRRRIQQDVDLGKSLGLQASPWGFANGERLFGASDPYSWEYFLKKSLTQAREEQSKGTPLSKIYPTLFKKNFKAPKKKAR